MLSFSYRPISAFAVLNAVILLTLSATAAPFQPVSARDPAQAAPAGGSADSWGPILSSDGRYVLFASAANNLVTISNRNPLPLRIAPRLNVFLRDRSSNTTTLVSANTSGTGGGNGDSLPTGLSSDGRFALFESSASDLVPSDTNGLTDIFIRDLVSNSTALVSISLNAGSANGASRGSVVTPDGRYVAFVSAASNLVSGDTNGIPDIFVRDLQTGTTTLVSVGAKNTNSTPSSLATSEAPDITPDGRLVAFYSTATNLVPGAGAAGEIYVRDLISGTTIWASSNTRALLGISNVVSYNHAISADGQYVAYQASTNAGISTIPNGRGIIVRFNTTTGLADLVSTNANIQTAAYEDIRSLDMTPDGRFIVFVANTNNGSTFLGTQIHLWDGQSEATTLVSADLSNSFTQGSSSLWPAVDPSGRFVAFLSSATNLVTNPLIGDYHLYVRDTQAGTTSLVGADTNGIGSSVGPNTAPRLSADGHLVAFESLDGNLVSDDRNRAYDIFLRDTTGGTNELISAHHPTLASSSPNGPSVLSSLSVSSNGRYIAFSSDADNIAANDTNGFRDVFVRDTFLGTTILVSANTNGVPADGLSSEPSISSDGRFVAFTSSADDLVPGDTNKAQDVFLRDLQSGTTTLVSWNTNGTGPGSYASYSPALLGNDRYVLFRTTAGNVAVGLPPGLGPENLVLRDLQSATTYAVSTSGALGAAATPDGRFIAFGGPFGSQNPNMYLWDTLLSAVVWTNATAPSSISTIGISPNGSRLVYVATNILFAVDLVANTNWPIGPALSGSRAGLRFSADGGVITYSGIFSNTNQIFLYDFSTGTNLLISYPPGALPSGPSDLPDISADGRFIAYRSFATNLTALADGNGMPDLFLFDRVLGSNSLFSSSSANSRFADNRSVLPIFSRDGRLLVFQSAASDLVSGDFNNASDVFAFALLYVSIAPASAGHGPTLTWPARSGETYQVQFKSNLTDPQWQQVTGNVTITGNQAQLIDLAPTAGQRFYRVVAF